MLHVEYNNVLILCAASLVPQLRAHSSNRGRTVLVVSKHTEGKAQRWVLQAFLDTSTCMTHSSWQTWQVILMPVKFKVCDKATITEIR